LRSRKDRRQSVRLPRNGFALRPNGRVCSAEHDRDLNAARNVLTEGRRIAAGLAEIENASLSGRRTGSGPAVCVEAGTRLGTLA
jgi:transposase